MAEFLMPSLGADMQEATLVKWLVKRGDRIKRGQVIGEVDTAKGVIDLECFQEGVVENILVNEGQTVPVGYALLSLATDDQPLASCASESASSSINKQGVGHSIEQTSQKNETAVSELVEKGTLQNTIRAAADQMSREKKSLQSAQKIEITEISTGSVGEANATSRPKVSPLARRRAAELGIDLTTVTTARVDHTIGIEDVESAAARRTTVATGRGPDASRVALRTAIAAAMSKSKSEIPHYYLQTSINMQKALTWLEQENKKRSLNDRLLPALLLIKAVTRALVEVPQLNGYWVDGQLRQSDKVHVGFAIAMKGGGLVAPAIHDVGVKSIDQLRSDLYDLVPRARVGRLRSSEMTDATITITNMGDLGVESVFGIIYPPQVALVGFGKVFDRPWVEAGELCIRPIVTASLSADHRATDGLIGARFLDSLGQLLQEPQSL